MLHLLLSASLALAAKAEGPPAPAVVVWVEPSIPPNEVQSRGSHLTGGPATHYSWADLALAPGDWTEDDRLKVLAVDSAYETGKKRWDEFDVEQGIAQQLQIAVESVSVLRDDADRKALLRALVMSGTAAAKAFPENKFATADDAASFRTMVSARAVPRALQDALALDAEHVWTRDEVGDGIGYAILSKLQEEVKAAPRAKLLVGEHPPETTLVVDGRVIDATTMELELLPGRHYVHAMIGNKIAGRTEITLEPGQIARYPLNVSAADLTAARTMLMDGNVQFTGPVATAIEALATVRGQKARVYVGALNEKGRPIVYPYSGGAEIERPNPFAVVLTGDLGGGFIRSAGFLKRNENAFSAGTVGGNLGITVSVYNVALIGGATLFITPTERMQYANADNSDNKDTPAYFRPHGGLGVYLPRPTAGVPNLLLGATYGAFFPGSSGPGGMLAFGVPMRGDGAWLRFVLDFYRGTQAAGYPGEGTGTYMFNFRVGFGRKL